MDISIKIRPPPPLSGIECLNPFLAAIAAQETAMSVCMYVCSSERVKIKMLKSSKSKADKAKQI